MNDLANQTVSVLFVDDATGKTFASSEMPIERLPDTFAIDTDIAFDGGQYVVTRAEPQTKDAFARTRRLTVALRKVKSLEPKKILYSLPSICGSALPATELCDGAGSVHVVVEDDWRQCEFVSTRYEHELSLELGAILHIHATAFDEVGWREIQVRKSVPLPLLGGTRWSDVVKELGPVDPGPHIALGDPRHAVSSSVAVQFGDGVLVWGVETAGELSLLCVENVEAASKETIAGLTCVADALSLVLVHWCRCQAYAPGGGALDNAHGLPWDASR